MAINPSKKGPYHGVGIYFIINIATCAVIFFIIWNTITKKAPLAIDKKSIDFLTSVIVASGVGFLFTLSTFVAGILQEPFTAVKERVVTFFQDIGIDFKQAASWWWYSVKTKGAAFWLYISYALLQAALLVWGVKSFILLI